MKKLSKAAYNALTPSAKGAYTKKLNASEAAKSSVSTTAKKAAPKKVTPSTKTTPKALPQKAVKKVEATTVRKSASTSGQKEY